MSIYEEFLNKNTHLNPFLTDAVSLAEHSADLACCAASVPLALRTEAVPAS